MILAGKYEILDRVGGAAITVDRARNTLSGRTVFLHRLASGSPFAADAMKLALKYVVRHPDNAVVLDVFDDSDSTYLVTADSPEYNSLLDFLPLALAGGNTPQQRSGSPSVQRPAPARETRVADASSFARNIDPKHDAVQPKATPPPERPDPEPAFPAAQPGEFTRAQPGEAMRAQPGEFTRMFSAPLTSPDAKEDILSPSFSPSKARPPSGGAGEFTRLFGSEAPPPPLSTDAARDLLGEKPSPPPITPAPTRTEPAAPGEFTRIISRDALAKSEPEQGPAPDRQLPKPPAAKPPAAKLPPPMRAQTRLQSKGVSPVLILVAALLIAAIAVIAFFMSRR